VLASTCAMLS